MDLYAPALPPGYKSDTDSESDQEPVEKKPKLSPKMIGPQCPEILQQRSLKESISSSSIIGPQLPTMQFNSSDDDNEDEIVGPMPNDLQSSSSDLQSMKTAIEKRATSMKNKIENKDISSGPVVEREEWMTVPDTSRKNQLGAISRCLAPSSKSSSKHKHSHRHSEKDKQTADELKKYNESKRSKSLLEMHKKEKKKKDKKKSKEKFERKAFDREEMDIRHFTKSQVNSVIDKAKYLNSRFSAGSQQYL